MESVHRYELKRKLATGGMGDVFLAIQYGDVSCEDTAPYQVALQRRTSTDTLALAVHYLAQGKGPYQTRCTLLRETPSQAVHRVEVHDRPTNTLMAVATVHA